MRIALLSDIHGNIVGLQAALARIDQLGGADVLFALGDFLAVGPGADDLIDLLLARQARMIRGNWDEIFMGVERYLEHIPPDAHAFVMQNYEWLMHNVSPDAQNLIAGLPLNDQIEVEFGRRLFVCHAAPDDPWSRACSANVPTATLRDVYGSVQADVVAYGHYHAHHIVPLDHKLLVNVASVGMKRGAQSAFTMLEYADERWTIQQYQTPYDTEQFTRLSRERGVPLRE
ncbi:MAG TPA: metallophosphoesterase family protein [Roseiflexaceae bacterium]|jgi:predicted phosphodiesterase|nr:metallophosphoesterase family protein [Roseiflexaceae bacterium]